MKMSGEFVGHLLVRAVRWVFPHTVTATRDDLGTLLFTVGWLGYPVRKVSYWTPLGEFEYLVSEQIGYEILQAEDWVSALFLVAHHQDWNSNGVPSTTTPSASS